MGVQYFYDPLTYSVIKSVEFLVEMNVGFNQTIKYLLFLIFQFNSYNFTTRIEESTRKRTSFNYLNEKRQKYMKKLLSYIVKSHDTFVKFFIKGI